MVRLLFLILSLVTTISSLKAQEPYEFVTSDVLFNKGYDHFLKEEYTGAVHYYKKIHRSDTNFHIAQYNTIIALYNNKSYEESDEIAMQALQDKNSYAADIYYWLIESLIAQGNHSKAKSTIKQALTVYPLYFSYQYQLGKILLLEGKTEAAEAEFKSILKSHPQHSESHYQIAHLNAKKGHYTEAILGYQFSILANRSSSLLQSAFVEMEDVMQNNFESNLKPKTKSAFKEIDQFISSQLALKSNYKTSLDLNYTVVRQTDLIFNQFNPIEGSFNFSSKLYGSFLEKVKEKNLENAYILYVISVLNVEDINKEIAKHKPELKAFKALLKSFMLLYQNQSKYEINGVQYEGDYHNNDYGILEGIGTKSNNLTIGDWIYFYTSGKIMSEIKYNASGSKHGKATWYDRKGNIIQYNTFKNDAYNGEGYFSHDNSCKWYSANFKNNKLNGNVELCDDGGQKQISKTFEMGMPIGTWNEYGKSGNVIVKSTYNKNGNLNGPYFSFYENGNKQLNTNFKNGVQHGEYTLFHPNKNIHITAKFADGLETGVWKEFNDKNTLVRKRTFENGEIIGNEYQFNDKGDTLKVTPYKKGKQHGTALTYTYSGDLIWKHKFKKGKLKSFENLDSLGAITHKGSSEYHINDAFGFKFKTGFIKGGQFDGEFKTYWKNGKVQTVKFISEGNLEGQSKEFDEAGNIVVIQHYYNDELNGKYESFYPSGKLAQIGYFQNGEKIGAWKSYHQNGKLSYEEYYSQGQSNGYRTVYTIEGIKKHESFYKGGIIQWTDVYDKEGKLFQRHELSMGNAELTLKHANNFIIKSGELKGGEWNGTVTGYYPNQQVSTQKTYINGLLHGEQKTFYPNGQLKESSTYEYNVKQGKYSSFYKNGNKHWEIHYENDQPIGTVVQYQEKGREKSLQIFNKNGDKTKVIDFHSNGKIRTSTPYFHGFIHGTRNTYDNTGQLAIQRKYNGGVLYEYGYNKNGIITSIPFHGEGELKTFYENGKIACSYQISDHVYEGKYLRYFSNGNPWIETNYKDDEVHGKYIVYFPNGKVKELQNFSLGTLNGVSIRYFKNGNKRSEENFIFGVQHGPSKYFDEEGQLIQTVTYNDNDIIDIK